MIKPDLGSLYILSNESLHGIIKIGFTNRDPENRARELSKSTSIPTDFVIEDDIFIENPQKYEALIHARLRPFRINPKKEFFRISVEDATSTINEIFFGTSDPGEAAVKRFTNTKSLLTKYQKELGLTNESIALAILKALPTDLRAEIKEMLVNKISEENSTNPK